MNMTKEQVSAGVNAGLALTSPESEILMPIKHAGGVLILHQLLIGIASGQLTLEAVKPSDEPAPPSPRKSRNKKK